MTRIHKTDEQINAEIEALKAVKPSVRKVSAFGDDNHEAIDAQIRVLTERMSLDDVYDAWGDEDSDEFEQHLLDAALEARDWMTGARAANEGSPSEGWA